MKKAGHDSTESGSAKKFFSEFLNSSPCSIKARNGQTLTGIALKPTECFARRRIKLNKLPPSATQSPFLGSTRLPLSGACVNASPSCENEKLAAFAVGGKTFAKLYRFFGRCAFRKGAQFTGHGNNRLLERPSVEFPYEQRLNSVLFDNDRNRTLEQSNGNDQMVLILDPQKNPLRTHEWTSLESDPLPRSHIGPRLNRTSRQRNGSDGSDFMVIHWLRPISGPCNSYNAWSR